MEKVSTTSGKINSHVSIREERPEDVDGIRAVNEKAFDQKDEARIVDALRANGGVLLSLVATSNERIVGHVLFSPVTIESGDEKFSGAGLGPMAVLPEFQRQGIGGKLIEAGKRKLRGAGCPFIFVLGHPQYYPRFGFVPAGRHELRCEWDVPAAVFMMLILDHAQMQGVTGLVKYRREFSNIEAH